MTLRGYYLQAARLQRASDRMSRRYAIRDDISVRLARVVRDHISMERFRVANKRMVKTHEMAADLLIAAATARHDARDRMLFDPWEYERERKRVESVRRHWS